METDASIQDIGAVLFQPQDDGKLHPVAFARRELAQLRITDLEILTVVWAVSHFGTYLYRQKVMIYTDHAAVKAVLQNSGASRRHAQWWTKVHGSSIKELTELARRMLRQVPYLRTTRVLHQLRVWLSLSSSCHKEQCGYGRRR